MFKLSLFVLLALNVHNSLCIVDDLYDAGTLVWDLYLIVDEINTENRTNAAKLKDIFALGKVENFQIKWQMDEIFKKFDEIEKFMNSEKINDPSKIKSSPIRLYMSVERLEEVIKNINDIYTEFQKYMKGEVINSEEALGELLRRIIADIMGDITWIRKVVIGESVALLENRNLIEAISEDAISQRDKLCDGPQLTTSILAQLFRMVVIAEIKTNFMLLFAYIHQYGNKFNGWNEMIAFSEAQLKKNFARYVSVFALNMFATDELYLRACDPFNNTWIRDENFHELEKTVQTTIVQYKRRKSSGSCNEVSATRPLLNIPREYSQRTGCSYVRNCFDLGAFETCVLKSGPHRFQYVNSTARGLLGTNTKCPRGNGYIFEAGEDWRNVNGACACDCYDGDNKISSSILESRLSSNWVITGLRFVRKNGILHIQPREGRLEANGYISAHNQRWVPIPDDPQVYTIHKMNKVFFLDDLRLPRFHALTGVQFIEETRGNITGFAIKIFGIKFNYKSGTCLSKEKFGMSMQGSDIITGSGISFRRVPPTYAKVYNTPNEAAFVTLTNSELAIDFGQSTLPFFDAIPIVTRPPSVLGGVGIFYKGDDIYAGFIALRVFGISYKTYLLNFQNRAIANGNVLFNSSAHH